MAAPGLLQGLVAAGEAAGKKGKSSKAAKAFGDPLQAAGKGRANMFAGDSDLGKAPLLSVLGSHRWETRPGSSKIVRVKRKP